MALPTKNTKLPPMANGMLYPYQRAFIDSLLVNRDPYDVIVLKLPWNEVRSFLVPAVDRRNPRFAWHPRGGAHGRSVAAGFKDWVEEAYIRAATDGFAILKYTRDGEALCMNPEDFFVSHEAD